MKKVLLLSILFLTACSSNTYQKITKSSALEMMKEEKNYVILDVRTKDEYYSKHLDNAINIPLDDIEKGKVNRLDDKDEIIFVYCQSGNRSKRASNLLLELGYTNVYDIGGINDWEE